MEQRYEILRILAEALYDHQDVRISSLNRVRNLIRRKLLELGFEPETKKKDDDESEPKWTDEELEKMMVDAQKKKLLSDADYNFLSDSFELAKNETDIEKQYENYLKPLIDEEQIWKEWLIYVNGISTRNTCRLLKYFGYCERFDTVSKLWAYSGLKVEEGHAVKRKKGDILGYNLKIKTGVLGVIGECLIKSNKSYKKRIYDPYKNRILERGCCENPKCKGKTGHAANMARRKMVKIFLSHYWMQCRKIKGLPIRNPYPHKDDDEYIQPFYDKKPDDV
ncbi:MAG TPA: hypothetical protein VI564_02345 [Candidatus Nanoarchaeia archaeon]|nr:hypothetical protein [Candidatus Nanoarchaeia archaeon]